jgi:hypothetical protein
LQRSEMRQSREVVGTPSGAAVLAAVETLIDRARTLQDLESQGLQLLAARRWRELGRPVPSRLLAQERVVAANLLVAPAVLRRIRSAYDGDILLLKGPEVAIAYPDAALRPYGDLDLLVSDAHAAQRALTAAGFEPVGNEAGYVTKHHLQPLRLPTLPLAVELHHRPHWPEGLKPPSTAELLEAGIPTRSGVPGILGLPPAQHALVLAANAWADAPLGNLRQLLDIALVAAAASAEDKTRLAARWGLSNIWAATVGALQALFGSARTPATLKLWARHLPSVRERTVLEARLTSWLSPLWGLAGLHGLGAGAAALAADLRPRPGQPWREKRLRVRLALAYASRSTTEHDARLREPGWPSEQATAAGGRLGHEAPRAAAAQWIALRRSR